MAYANNSNLSTHDCVWNETLIGVLYSQTTTNASSTQDSVNTSVKTCPSAIVAAVSLVTSCRQTRGRARQNVRSSPVRRSDAAGVKPDFHYPSWRPELTGDRFPLPVTTGRVDGRALVVSGGYRTGHKKRKKEDRRPLSFIKCNITNGYHSWRKTKVR